MKYNNNKKMHYFLGQLHAPKCSRTPHNTHKIVQKNISFPDTPPNQHMNNLNHFVVFTFGFWLLLGIISVLFEENAWIGLFGQRNKINVTHTEAVSALCASIHITQQRSDKACDWMRFDLKTLLHCIRNVIHWTDTWCFHFVRWI